MSLDEKESPNFTIECIDGNVIISQTTAMLVAVFASQITTWKRNTYRVDYTADQARGFIARILPPIDEFLMGGPDAKKDILTRISEPEKIKRNPDVELNTDHNIYVNDLDLKYGDEFVIGRVHMNWDTDVKYRKALFVIPLNILNNESRCIVKFEILLNSNNFYITSEYKREEKKIYCANIWIDGAKNIYHKSITGHPDFMITPSPYDLPIWLLKELLSYFILPKT